VKGKEMLFSGKMSTIVNNEELKKTSSWEKIKIYY